MEKKRRVIHCDRKTEPDLAGATLQEALSEWECQKSRVWDGGCGKLRRLSTALYEPDGLGGSGRHRTLKARMAWIRRLSARSGSAFAAA